MWIFFSGGGDHLFVWRSGGTTGKYCFTSIVEHIIFNVIQCNYSHWTVRLSSPTFLLADNFYRIGEPQSSQKIYHVVLIGSGKCQDVTNLGQCFWRKKICPNLFLVEISVPILGGSKSFICKFFQKHFLGQNLFWSQFVQ